MNKYFKYGLLLQIPNISLILAFIIFNLIIKVNWLTISNNLFLIISISIYALINVFSLIFFIVGLTNKPEVI